MGHNLNIYTVNVLLVSNNLNYVVINNIQHLERKEKTHTFAIYQDEYNLFVQHSYTKNIRFMKILSKFKVRAIAGEHIIVNQGENHTDKTKIISLNNSALLLFQELSGKDFTSDDAAQFLIDTFGISKEQADRDASAWIAELKNCGVIE